MTDREKYPESAEGAARAAREAERRLGPEDDARLRDPRLVPGSKHYASMLAFGNFDLAEGGTVLCLGVQGVGGVTTAANVERANGHSTAGLVRVLTHFDWPDPPLVIEQNPYRASYGTLSGEGDGELLPGTATFSQFLILTLDGRPLINREPLVMTARVTRWPPIGAVFESEAPTDFYAMDALPDVGALADPEALASVDPVASLAACKTAVIEDFQIPSAADLQG